MVKYDLATQSLLEGHVYENLIAENRIFFL